MAESTCVNLLERFGGKYRVEFDPAYDPYRRPREKLDPWYMVIPCRAGEIYPHGGSMLVVEVEGHCYTRKKLRNSRAVVAYNEGDNCGRYMFHVDDFDKIAEIVKPRRKRRMTPEQREQKRKLMLELHARRAESDTGTSEIE